MNVFIVFSAYFSLFLSNFAVGISLFFIIIMQSIVTVIYFLPSIIALIWTVSFAFKKRSMRQNVFMCSQLLATFYFLCYALYTLPNVDYPLMVRMDAFNIPISLTMMALTLMYMHMYYSKSSELKPWYMLLIAPALVIGSVCGTIYFILGFDNAAEVTRIYDQTGVFPKVDAQTMKLYETYNIFAEHVFSIVGGILGFALMILCVKLSRREGYKFGDVFRFFFKRHESTPGRILSTLFIFLFLLLIPMILLGRTYLMHHTTVSIVINLLLAVVQHCICHVESYSDACPTMTLHSLANVNLAERAIVVESAPAVAEEVPAAVEEEPKSQDSAFMKMVYDKFHQLIEEEELYRDENLTLITLSEKINVSRTTLSQMIKIHYGMPFRDVITKYRIEAAMRFMRANPAATQDVIAAKCGYKNGNYLNSKFKEVVGETPLVWLSKQTASEE